jgi:hypothetical protein
MTMFQQDLDAAANVANMELELWHLEASMRAITQAAPNDDVAHELGTALNHVRKARARLTKPSATDSRREIRLSRPIITSLLSEGGKFEVVIVDLSVGGARLEFEGEVTAGAKVQILIPNCGPVAAEVLSQNARAIHVRFCDISEAQIMSLRDNIDTAVTG